MVEMKKEISSIDEAVDYLKMRLKTSPLRFQFIKQRVVEELIRVGLGEFTDEQAKEILDKVDQQ
jgi:hypothetical protein